MCVTENSIHARVMVDICNYPVSVFTSTAIQNTDRAHLNILRKTYDIYNIQVLMIMDTTYYGYLQGKCKIVDHFIDSLLWCQLAP